MAWRMVTMNWTVDHNGDLVEEELLEEVEESA